MNIKKTIKFVRSLICGCLSTATSRDIPDAGVKLSPLEKFTRTTPCCSYCLKAFNEHRGGITAISKDERAIIQEHVQHCPENPLVQKLEAAAEALREIKIITCRSNYLNHEDTCELYNMALDAHNAATQK